MMRRGLVACLLVAASATTLRDVCPNKGFELRIDAPEEPWLLAPHDHPMRDGDAVVSLVQGRRALEIGGPSPNDVNIYALLASCDNLALFDDVHHNRLGYTDGAPFEPLFDGVAYGRQIVGDAANLTNHVAVASYEVVYASHVLEHMQDPFGALLGWDRVLEPGGVMFLILPWRETTFDRLRSPDTLERLLQKHVRAKADASYLMEGFEQTVRAMDMKMDHGFPPGSDHQALRERTLNSPLGMQMLHWHVFDFALIRNLLDCLGYEIIAMDLIRPFHQVVVARKPLLESRGVL
ncbi:hypothetical protein M885DRAFT_504227 [Pelagophyceae sp. CCMP2097]|nr:hypothetical protein M885DRAFT_504227 [Pelagophyceae sp. CCMP2097]